MKYIELTVHTTTPGSELVSDVFWEYTDGGVAISDVNDVIALSKQKPGAWDYMDDGVISLRGDVLCKGYVPADRPDIISEIEARLNRIKKAVEFNVGSLETVKREVEGDEWLERWKEHFRPIKIGKVTVCPEWIEYAPEIGETVTKIDSNMAFGTGEHETTSMCIELLQKYLKPDSDVIDVGCGSGILGITAKKLGARSVLMTDIDVCAVEAAEHNAEINGAHCDVRCENLLDDETAKGDLLLANIMAEILIGFSQGIINNLKNGGVIILSGILDTRLSAVLAAYKSAGFTELETLAKGEWRAVAMRCGG